MGYRFLPPSNPLNRNFPTYFLQGTGLRDGPAAQAKPSYSQVTQLSLQGLSRWPTPQFTSSAPETNAPPEFMAEIEKDVRGLRGEPKAGTRTLPATTLLDPKKGQFCGDTSQLLEIVPGHHHFKASDLATVLCKLVKTDRTPADMWGNYAGGRPYVRR